MGSSRLLQLFEMRGVPASTTAQLLTCEGVLTSVLGWVAFHEHFDQRIVLGFLAKLNRRWRFFGQILRQSASPVGLERTLASRTP